LSITQTVLVFVGIPAAVIALVFAAVYGGSARRSTKRYRPGRPFQFTPVWFLAAPEQVAAKGDKAAELTAGERHTELPAGPLLAQESGTGAAPAEPASGVPATVGAHGDTGGASDSW
jgi:hypothetical protein